MMHAACGRAFAGFGERSCLVCCNFGTLQLTEATPSGIAYARTERGEPTEGACPRGERICEDSAELGD